MGKVYVFLADGLEEIEGLTVVDILRRAGVDTEMVSVTGSLDVTGSHGIQIKADVLFEDISAEEGEMFVLPGGMPGTKNLAAHAGLAEMLKEADAAGRRVAAICAAPSVLGGLGILKGRRAVCYPGFEDRLEGAEVTDQPVEVCGHVTTSRGMGTAIPFALALTAALKGQETADTLGKSILWE